jgi:hypothetical protein
MSSPGLKRLVLTDRQSNQKRATPRDVSTKELCLTSYSIKSRHSAWGKPRACPGEWWSIRVSTEPRLILGSVPREVKINQGDIEQMVNTAREESALERRYGKPGTARRPWSNTTFEAEDSLDLILVGQVPAISLLREREGLFPREVGQFPGALDRSDFGARPLGMIALDAQ